MVWRVGGGLAILLGLFLAGIGFRADTLPHPVEAPFSDATISRYPDALYFQWSLRDHHTLPLWNPHLMGGQPFAANVGTKTFYPLTWLLLLWSPTLHLNLMTFFHLWLGGLGMWVWARGEGLKSAGAWISALAYLFAPKMLAHAGAGHLDLLMAMGWLPWFLVALQQLFKSRRYATLGVAFTAGMILIGAIQLVPYLYGLGGAYVLRQMWHNPQRTPIIRALALAGVLGLGLTAVQWLPLYELREATSRGEIRPEDAALGSIQPAQFIGLLIGDHGGNQETLTFVGISVLLLAGFGWLLKPRHNRLWWGVVIFAALYSLGDYFPLWRGVVEIFPPALLFRVPSRAWFLSAFLLPYLAGYGWQTLTESPLQTARARLGVVGLIGLGLSCSGGSLVILRQTEIEMTALIGIFFLPVTAFLFALIIFRAVETRVLTGLVLVLVLADCLWIDRTLIEGRPQSDWLDPTPPAAIAHLAQTGERIYTPDYAIPQQDTAYWGIARFDGVDPFQMSTFIDQTPAVTGIPRVGYSTTVPAIVVLEDDPDSQKYRAAPMNARLLGQWGVKWVITQYPLEVDGLTLASQEEDLYFYQNTFAWAEGTTLIWESPNRVRQTLANNTEEVYTVVNVPQWEAVSSKPIPEQMTLGTRSDTFVYKPEGVFWGLRISGLTLALIALSLVGRWARERFYFPI